jgi:hypothetical protein
VHAEDVHAEVFVPYEDRSSEELAAGHPDGDWVEDIGRVVDEGLGSEQPTIAGVAAEIDLERDLDDLTQLEATWAPESTPFDDAAETRVTEVTQAEALVLLDAEPPREDDWKARAGIGTGRPRGRRDA